MHYEEHHDHYNLKTKFCRQVKCTSLNYSGWFMGYLAGWLHNGDNIWIGLCVKNPKKGYISSILREEDKEHPELYTVGPKDIDLCWLRPERVFIANV